MDDNPIQGQFQAKMYHCNSTKVDELDGEVSHWGEFSEHAIHLFQEIAILEFPTSDCFQIEAICDNTLTAALAPLEIHGDVQKDTTSCWSSRRARIDLRISLPYYLNNRTK